MLSINLSNLQRCLSRHSCQAALRLLLNCYDTLLSTSRKVFFFSNLNCILSNRYVSNTVLSIIIKKSINAHSELVHYSKTNIIYISHDLP